MSEYEFWNELGNIFNAVVAYQQKTIEFNKRFVNPWIRLGTVFDKDDRNAETVSAHKKAIEIDPQNAANWLALGDVYFKMGSFDDAAAAYGQAIELDPKNGWAYTNLALTLATRQNYTEAINLYIKSLEFLADEKDRAMTWNRLGNAYRKVNDYENAFIAFQRADECDAGNTGFADPLDDAPEQVVVALEGELPVITDEIALPDTVVVDVNDESAPAQVDVEQSPQAEPAEVMPVADVAVTADVEPIVDAVEERVLAVEENPVAEAPAVSVDEVAEVEPAAVEAVAEVEQPVEALPVVEEPVAEAEPVAVEVIAEVEQPVEVLPVVEEPIAEVEAEPVAVEVIAEAEQPVETSPVVEEAVVEETVVEIEQPVETPVAVEESAVDSEQPVEAIAVAEPASEPVSESVPVEVVVEEMQPEVVAEAQVVETSEAVIASTEAATDTTVTAVLMHTVETIADASALNPATVVVVDAEVESAPLEAGAEVVSPVQEAVAEELVAEVPVLEAESQPVVQVEADAGAETTAEAEIQPVIEAVVEEISEVVAEAEVQETVETVEIVAADVQAEAETAPVNEANAEGNEAIIREIISLTIDGKAGEVAYEEYLKDSVQPVLVNEESPQEVTAQETATDPIVVKSEIKVELDTKNAHVWNELGNVYFNSGAYEEAITAYGRAIELDTWFAWPYSNLALAYVQKEKYTEAVLLYQRSIELFSSDKDKAVTWNRLGNVYRRLNDYDNAIASYQRADELDPNNATRSLRSRFSLLGSFNMEQSASFAA